MKNKKLWVIFGIFVLLLFVLWAWFAFLAAFSQPTLTFRGQDLTPVVQNGKVLYVSPDFYVDTDANPIMKVVVAADPPGSSLHVFWVPRYGQNFDFENSFSCPTSVLPGDKTQIFNFKNMAACRGGVSKLLLRDGGGGQSVKIKEVSFWPEEGPLGFWSAWQKFWALTPLDVRRVNRFWPPAWGSQSFIIIIYVIILLSFIGAALFLLLKKLRGKQFLAVLMVLFAGWLVLDLRFSFDYLRESYHDARYFVLSPASAKKDIIYKGPISDFVGFCEANLPKNAKIAVKGPYEYQTLILSYLLLPMQPVSIEQAGYIIGFDVPKEQVAGFVLYKDFKDIGWILKRR